MSGLNTAAPATTVNRTHRVVRERARTLQANRSRMRGLMLPLLLSSALMIMLFSAFWVMLDQYEIVASETPEHTHHFFLLLLWFLPVSVAMLAMVWYRRARNQSDAEAAR
ncbi:hypothetical protein [Granulicella arctica]|uniref:Cytochrome bd-type quinol oxidase subunit 2 n=1 Tax=Granulicella arctica TaxID=940613 RepID=A0A7Y9PF45_9BACT|nr:hypothetical protein [Granulicella arctica]NYF78018.1 cytochrome bd-type quinol oxidase subunit 2 [Granulicella arctica]